jgi:hypothetical protein
MPTTSGMKQGGYYDTHSDAQRAAIGAFVPWLVDALAELPIPPAGGPPLVLLDLGSSQGRNAILAMRRLVAALRRRTAAPAWVLFSDLPTNDFNQLFSNLFPPGPPAFTEVGVFPAAIAGSAYKPVVPPRSLHVATSFNMIGWLDARPAARLPSYILPMGPSASSERASVSEAEREPFRLQAAADLRGFYRARAEELVPGGKLLLQVFGRDDVRSASDGIYDVLSDALLDLVVDGVLPRQVYDDLVFPVYFRTVRELTAPVEADGELAGAFRVEQADTREVGVPFNEERERTGDIAAWARGYTGFLRAFTEPVLAVTIPETSAAFGTVEEVYRRVEHLLIQDPMRYEFRYISVGALLTWWNPPQATPLQRRWFGGFLRGFNRLPWTCGRLSGIMGVFFGNWMLAVGRGRSSRKTSTVSEDSSPRRETSPSIVSRRSPTRWVMRRCQDTGQAGMPVARRQLREAVGL